MVLRWLQNEPFGGPNGRQYRYYVYSSAIILGDFQEFLDFLEEMEQWLHKNTKDKFYVIRAQLAAWIILEDTDDSILFKLRYFR